MAEYVVVDKDQLETDLGIVCDAIREKGGTSEPLVFPNGMKEAVEAIQSGTSNSFPYTVTVGEITPTSDLTEMNIEIGEKMGSKFMFYCMCNELVKNTVKGSEVGCFYYSIREDVSNTYLQPIKYRFRRNTTSGALSSASDGNVFVVNVDNSVTLKSYNENHFYRAGCVYKWFCINLDDEV